MTGLMNSNKIKLGTYNNEVISLTKHTWDCGWYWGMGYVGNRNCHFHIDTLITGECEVDKIFSETWITQSTWWVIRDLFMQAYSLKSAAETYRHGGHQISKPMITDILKCQSKADGLNDDLKILLDSIWLYLNNEFDVIVMQSLGNNCGDTTS